MNKFNEIAETETLRASLPKLMENDKTALTNGSSTDFPAASEDNIGRFFHHSEFNQVYFCHRNEANIIEWKYLFTPDKSLMMLEDGYYAAKGHTHAEYVEASQDVTFQKSVEITQDLLLSGQFYSNSDKRIKNTIRPIDDALAMIEQINGRIYKLNSDGSTQYGVIAQDVQAAAPFAVTTRNDKQATLAVNYNGLVALLIESVKTLSDKIDNLENRVFNVENK